MDNLANSNNGISIFDAIALVKTAAKFPILTAGIIILTSDIAREIVIDVILGDNHSPKR